MAPKAKDKTPKAKEEPQTLPEKVQIQLGLRVLVSSKVPGVVRFFGTTEFAEGNWVGVELEEPFGKNDGTVKGIRYFTCEARKGLFCRPNCISVAPLAPQSGVVLQQESDTTNVERCPPVAGDAPAAALSESNQPPARLSLSSSKASSGLRVGVRAMVKNAGQVAVGIVAFFGGTSFAEGDWVGLVLDSDDGKNDGSVQGVKYFDCPPNRGIFVRPNKVVTGASEEKKTKPKVKKGTRKGAKSSAKNAERTRPKTVIKLEEEDEDWDCNPRLPFQLEKGKTARARMKKAVASVIFGLRFIRRVRKSQEKHRRLESRILAAAVVRTCLLASVPAVEAKEQAEVAKRRPESLKITAAQRRASLEERCREVCQKAQERVQNQNLEATRVALSCVGALLQMGAEPAPPLRKSSSIANPQLRKSTSTVAPALRKSASASATQLGETIAEENEEDEDDDEHDDEEEDESDDDDELTFF